MIFILASNNICIAFSANNLEDLVKQFELEGKLRLLRDAKKQEKIASMLAEMKIYGISLEDLMDAESYQAKINPH